MPSPICITGTVILRRVKKSGSILFLYKYRIPDQNPKPKFLPKVSNSPSSLTACDQRSNDIRRWVHGSLARAGKVRGQTPKVAKQDKKKKPRGRAHKRMQYNRRFVTAVVGFGKKRGPNSSEK
ncbi:Small ribosomal subunit protein eS30 - like 1 [Theobroma cacao]|nr:Small ribosomal subunit protein eS30 - like 1 [Theobroma cacao]